MAITASIKAQAEFLGQEPNTHLRRVTGLNAFHILVYANVERPSTYIYAHKSLHIWPMENMNTQDTAVAMIDTGIETIGKIILCSVYWDGRIDTFPEKEVETIEKEVHQLKSNITDARAASPRQLN